MKRQSNSNSGPPNRIPNRPMKVMGESRSKSPIITHKKYEFYPWQCPGVWSDDIAPVGPVFNVYTIDDISYIIDRINFIKANKWGPTTTGNLVILAEDGDIVDSGVQFDDLEITSFDGGTFS